MTLRKAYASAGRRFPQESRGRMREKAAVSRKRGGGGSGWCAQASLQHS